MTALVITLYAMAGLSVIGVALAPIAVGKPRKPLSETEAVCRVVIGLAFAAVYVMAARGLS